MAATASNLVDRVLPDVPVRHWVLSLPFEIRHILAKDRSLLSAVLRIFIDVVSKSYRERSRCGVPGRCGAVAAIHRSDSSLRIDPHFHTLFLDGTYEPTEDEGGPIFRLARAPTDEELRSLAARAASRVRHLFIQRGLVDKDGSATTLR